MKIDNEKNKFQKNVMFTNRLQNCPTKRKSNTKGGKDNNTKISVSIFNNTIIKNSKLNSHYSPRSINHSSSFINPKDNNNKIFCAYKLCSKRSAANLKERNNDISQIVISRNTKLKTSIINDQNPTPNKKYKNKFYSPSSPYTPSISSNSSSSWQINTNVYTKFPSSFNYFIIPSRKIDINQVNPSQYRDPQDVFNQKMDLVKNIMYKEIDKLSKKLAGIDYNKGIQLAKENQLYIKKMKELYEERERKMIHVYDKYKIIGLESLKYRERKQYLEMYKCKAKELLQIEDDFICKKDKIKTKYQMDYELIKKREQLEIKNLLEKNIIEKARKKLLKIIDNDE